MSGISVSSFQGCATGQQPRMPVSSNRNSAYVQGSPSGQSTSQHGGVYRTVVQQPTFPRKLGHPTQIVQSQIRPNQAAVQPSRLTHQTARGTLGGSVVGMAGGRYFISPLQQAPAVQQSAVLPGGMILNQVQVAGARPQGPVIANRPQQLSHGVWQPHDLSSIPPVGSDSRACTVDGSTILASQGNLNPFGGLSSGQLAHQGWIVRPPALLQQPHIMFHPSQASRSTFPAGIQVAGVQGVSGDASSSQTAGRRLGLYTTHQPDRS